jgi:hypothetical protein
MRIRTYTELRQLETMQERFDYLKLHGFVGESTFGFDRWMNQEFYRSHEWRSVRVHVIARDSACDLGIEGYEIHHRLTIHHMNPMSVGEIAQGDSSILDPEFLITVANRTHNAIHYGDESLLPRPFVERRPGDTNLW